MVAVKYICLIFAVAFSSVSFESVRDLIMRPPSHGLIVFAALTFYTLARAIYFGAIFYGIQKRNILAWKYGWIGFASLVTEMLITMISTALKMVSPDCWVMSIGVTVVTGIIAWYLALAWKGQRSYFTPENSP